MNSCINRTFGLTPIVLYDTLFLTLRTAIGRVNMSVAYVLGMIDVLGKGIDYILLSVLPDLIHPSIRSSLLSVSATVLCLEVLISGLTLGSYSHDAKWTLFQGCPILAVLTTAIFTFQLIDLAKLLVKLPGFNALDDLITMPEDCQGLFYV